MSTYVLIRYVIRYIHFIDEHEWIWKFGTYCKYGRCPGDIHAPFSRQWVPFPYPWPMLYARVGAGYQKRAGPVSCHGDFVQRRCYGYFWQRAECYRYQLHINVLTFTIYILINCIQYSVFSITEYRVCGMCLVVVVGTVYGIRVLVALP